MATPRLRKRFPVSAESEDVRVLFARLESKMGAASMWLLILGILLAPLIVNVLQWRRDLDRVDASAAARKKVSIADLLLNGAPRVSFLVTAWNEESSLQASIEAILALDYPNLETVLCAGGTDRTWQIASRFQDRLILLDQQPGDGKQKSLRRCLESATGEIIYLVDADCLITAAAFARILHPILSGGEQAVTCNPCTPFPEQLTIPFVVSQCASRIYTSIYKDEYCSGLAGTNSAIRREALQHAGGFNSDVRTGTDYDLGKRLLREGYRIRYDANASFPIEFHTQIRAYLRQQSRWLRNVVILGMRFRTYREAAASLSTSFVGLAMLVLPFMTLALALSRGVPGAIAWMSATVWWLAFSHAFFSRLRYVKVAAIWLGIGLPPHTIALLPVFLAIDFLAWTMPLAQYWSKSWRDRW